MNEAIGNLHSLLDHIQAIEDDDFSEHDHANEEDHLVEDVRNSRE